MKCGLLKISVYFCLFSALLSGVLFVAFGIPSLANGASGNVLSPVLNFSSPNNVREYVKNTYSQCVASTSFAVNSTGASLQLFSTSSTLTTNAGFEFTPRANLTFDQLGVALDFAPAGTNFNSLFMVIFDATASWNSVPASATTTSQTLFAISDPIGATSTSATLTMFNFQTSRTMIAGHKYLIHWIASPVSGNPFSTNKISVRYWTYSGVPGSGCYGQMANDFLNDAIQTGTTTSYSATILGVQIQDYYWKDIPFSNDSITGRGFFSAEYNAFGYFGIQVPNMVFYRWSTVLVPGCTDNMAINYNPLATSDDGSCYYVLPEASASSTRILNFTFSTSTNMVNVSYFVNTSQGNVLLYSENKNDRDGVIVSAYASTTAGTTTVNNNPITLPNPTAGSGFTYLTLKLVLASDKTRVFDYKTLLIDLAGATEYTPGGSTYQQQDCGITSLGGCFQNALATMFYPTQQSMSQFYTFTALVQTKPPGGYFTVVKNNISGLNSTSSPAFAITLPASLKTYIFNPFDVGVAGILWFFFALNFYKRLKHITV